MARALAQQVAAITAGDIEVSGTVVPPDRFATVFDEQIATQFAGACVDLFTKLLNEPPATVFVVEGVRRPYHLGPKTAARIAALARQGDGDVYGRLTSIVGSIQRLAPPTEFPPQLTVRTPDGVVGSCAIWDPRRETLLPPCDFLLLRASETTKIRVPHDRIAEVVKLPGREVVHGAPIDEFQWLLGAQDEATARRLVEHAGTIGTRLRMPDPRPHD